ncbi:MAG: spore germination protein [Clostridia bacterium]|nr:spore germination protein [Clostridia bacterium]
MNGKNGKQKKNIIKSLLKPITYHEPTPVQPFILKDLPDEQGRKTENIDLGDRLVKADLDDNLKSIKNIFEYPTNKDIIIREIKIVGKLRAFLVFIEGMSERPLINDFVLRPLMEIGTAIPLKKTEDICNYIYDSVLSVNHVTKHTKFKDIILAITTGDAVLFLDGCDYAIAVEAKGYAKRAVEKPVTESVVKGPQEGFTEDLRTNITLIRRIIKNNDLVTEIIELKTRNNLRVALMYIRGITNPDLVHEARRRIMGIKADFILGDGILSQLIEDHPLMLFPQLLETERPDRTASQLIEGRIAIFADGAPFSIVAPATFQSFIHSSEDSYLRWPYGTFLRFIRLGALFFSPMLPALYIAITLYHPEMIPTELLIAIAQMRENVPFPTVVEVIMMELAFELIREAGVRIPGLIGTTLGIIGALILGQAAVAANIVSPIMIIVVAVTGLGNFALPNISVTYAVRILRFIFIILASFYGIYGIGVGLVFIFGLVTYMKSFGVPFLAPLAPFTSKNPDIFLRFPVWKQEERPDFIQSVDRKRQPKISRTWTKRSPKKGNKE